MNEQKQPAVGALVEPSVMPAAVVGMTAAGSFVGGVVNGAALPWTAVDAEPVAILLRPLPVGERLYDQAALDAAVAAERERIAAHFDSRDRDRDGKPLGLGYYEPHEPAEIIRALGPNDQVKPAAAGGRP